VQINGNRIPLTDNKIIEQVCFYLLLQVAQDKVHSRVSLLANPMFRRQRVLTSIVPCSHAQSLGKHGIICIEDLIHEIYTVGPHFKEASNFLWPFQLSSAGRLCGAVGFANREGTRPCFQVVHA
jgi:hypothetical protein